MNIMEMLQQCRDGANSDEQRISLYPHELERFAALVAAAEREACAKVCEAEAWRLKKIAVDTQSKATNSKAIQAADCAAAIRARGQG